MKTYIKFLTSIFLKSFLYVIFVILSLVFIINLLTEIEFFKNIDVSFLFTIYLSILNSPALIFEIFPFIFLIATQLFYIKLLNNDEIKIFKYSGLKNSKILIITSLITLCLGFFIISLFYNTSSNLKKLYLELKSNYTEDGKYLAVINKNGLWIRDIVDNKILIVNASKFDENILLNSFITEFSSNYEVIRSIKSNKIDISKNEWIIYEPEIFIKNNKEQKDSIKINSNFDYKRINSLFSNLSSLSFFELIELKKNYDLLNYSTIDIDIQIQKIISYPLYLILMTIIATIVMLGTKNYKSNTLKLSIGLFLCVIIYYFKNLFNVLGATEKMNIILSIWSPLLFLSILTMMLSFKINEK